MSINIACQKTWAYLLLALGLTLITAQTMACSCTIGSLSEVYEQSDVVFVARIRSVTNPQRSRHDSILYGFDSIKSYKGSVRFGELSTTNGSCGIVFEENSEYLVFSMHGGGVVTCGATRKVNSADESASKREPWLEAIEAFEAGTDAMVPAWTSQVGNKSCWLKGEMSPGGKLTLGYRAKNSIQNGTHVLRFNTPITGEHLAASHIDSVRTTTLQVGQTTVDIVGSSSGGKLRKVLDENEFDDLINDIVKMSSPEEAVATLTADGEKSTVRISSNSESSKEAIHDFLRCMQQF